MSIGGFQVGPFQTDFQQQQGIGIVALPGIGIGPVEMVDFLIAGPGIYGAYPILNKVVNLELKRAVKQENTDLQEMMEMYKHWKAA